MTLVEVVAALVILAMLLTTMLAAQGRLARQWNLSTRRAQAVRVADGLLGAWMIDANTFPRQKTGRVEGEAGLYWRTSIVRQWSAVSATGDVPRRVTGLVQMVAVAGRISESDSGGDSGGNSGGGGEDELLVFDVVRLEIYERTGGGGAVNAAGGEVSLVSVEVLLPLVADDVIGPRESSGG